MRKTHADHIRRDDLDMHLRAGERVRVRRWGIEP